MCYLYIRICKLFCYASSSKDKEVLSVTNQLASHHEVDELTTNFQKPDNELPTSSFMINDDYKDEEPTPGYAVIDTKNVRKTINITF